MWEILRPRPRTGGAADAIYRVRCPQALHRIAPFKMLPSENRRAIYDVTFGRLPARGALHRECPGETRVSPGQVLHYRQASRREKQRLLDECCRVTGYHRKYVVRRLNSPGVSGRLVRADGPRPTARPSSTCSRRSGKRPATPGPSASRPCSPCGCPGPEALSADRGHGAPGAGH